MNAPLPVVRPAAASLIAALCLFSTATRAATNTVNISGFAFVPPALTIHVGDTVVWVQDDTTQHTTTSDASPPIWNSGLLSKGQSFAWTFNTAGTFPYHCIPHASFMKGTITVEAAANVPPTVHLTSPTNGMMFVFPADFVVAADATDSDGTVAQVEFLAGTNLLGTLTTAPYSLRVTNLTAGIYSLTARATDNQGATTTSDPVGIMIDSPPTVRLTSPGNGAVFLTPANISLQVSAADSDGTIAQIEYYDGTNELGTLTQPPFTLVWTNVPLGVHVLTATAVDDMGAETTSATQTVTVATASVYAQHNLVSDLPALADHQDTNLLNPWGIAFSPTSPFWIGDNHSGFSTLYNTDGSLVPLVVAVPPPGGGTPPASPTGVVFNGGTNFALSTGAPARFIFATEDGTISGWAAGTNAELKVDNSAANAIYKSLASASNGGTNLLYAADFHNGRIDVFDGNYAKVDAAGGFLDPTIPSGYAPFGIQNIDGQLYVTYAMQDANKEDDISGPGQGFVDVYDPAGNLLRRFASAGPLNSPWGVALAPAGFGRFGGALLIGNFGDGLINAFNPATGDFLGTLKDGQGEPIANPGLWALAFGNGVRGGDGARLYFTAGIAGDGSLEDHGLFGSISAVAGLVVTSVKDDGQNVQIAWGGGSPPYLVQTKNTLADPTWMNVLTTSNTTATVVKVGAQGFFRVQDNASTNVIPFSVVLNGANERPTAVDTPATGQGFLSLQGSLLTYNLHYQDLFGVAQAAHLHGPATTAQSTGVLEPFSLGQPGTSGFLTGTLTLNSDEVTSLLSGKVYANIHTPTHVGGEIRGQVVPVHWKADLNGAAEGSGVVTSGLGTADVTVVGTEFTYTVVYSGLSTNAVAAHVHGPAPPGQAANVLFGLQTPTGTAGTLTGTHLLTPDELADFVDGLTYVNIHTTLNPGGEIRGQLVPSN